MINEDLLKDIFAGILLFISGFLTAKYYPYLKSTKKKKEEKFQDIKESEDADTLILVLLNNYKHKKLHHFIDELELQKYKKSSKSFKEIKKQLLESLK
jgi:predicted HAD superfamily phosphohydrolase YqeG